MSDPDPYQRLAAFFHAHRTAAAAVEILPFPGVDIQELGSDVGVTKRALSAAFVTARHLFFSRPTGPASEQLRDATAVILLFAPEHVTAANWRKRQLADAGQAPSAAVLEELALLTTLTTSPLPKHPKSPTLWAHRAWVASGERLRALCAAGQDAFWRGEVAVVLKAADRHFANYYAFGYARQLKAKMPDLSPEADGWALAAVRDWCFRHHSDISGWAFLDFLAAGDAMRRKALRADVDSFAEHVGARGEALKWFLIAAARPED